MNISIDLGEYDKMLARIAQLESALRFWMPSNEPVSNSERWHSDRQLAFSVTALETIAKPANECLVCRRQIGDDDIRGSCANTKDGHHRRMIRDA